MQGRPKCGQGLVLPLGCCPESYEHGDIDRANNGLLCKTYGICLSCRVLTLRQSSLLKEGITGHKRGKQEGNNMKWGIGLMVVERCWNR